MALTRAETDALKIEAAVGSDTDLPVADRRTRTDAAVVVDAKVTVFGQQVTVLGPGRGRGTFLAAWDESPAGTRVKCIGTFFAKDKTP